MTPQEFETLQQELGRLYSADLEVTKQANLLNASQGDTISYTVTVKNVGNSKASNITLVDRLPDGTVESKKFNELNPDESRIETFNFTIPLSVKDNTTIVNTAEVSGFDILGNPDDSVENNKANASTIINSSTPSTPPTPPTPPTPDKKIEISSIANCQPGDFVTGGGFVLTGDAKIQSSKPLISEDGWQVTAIKVDQGDGSVKAFAVCFDNISLES